MDEIRFNSPNPNPKVVLAPEPASNAEENFVKPKTKKRINKKVLLNLFVAVVVLALVFIFGPVVKDFVTAKFSADKEQFSAVFLTNGQVYFGEIRDISRTEIVLENVYYLQVNSAGTQGAAPDALNQSFKLVKLGDELHGPTDELFINRDQVVFYEYLRGDSSVVQSIRNKK